MLLKFELAYYVVAVQYVSHYAVETFPHFFVYNNLFAHISMVLNIPV